MIIYKATNKINNKIYIGQTIVSLQRREYDHKWKARSGSGTHFANAIRKYGEDKFKWEILRICDNIDSLNAFEKYFILYYDSINNGYNLQDGGGDYTQSEKTKEKIRLIKLNTPQKVKDKISRKVTKLWQKPQYKDNMINAHLGNKSSVKQLEKMRKYMLNMPDSHRENLRIAQQKRRERERLE